MKHLLWVFTLLLLSDSLLAQAPSGYQMPPKAIADLANAPQPPALRINSSREWMMLMERPGYPSIEELAQPELRDQPVSRRGQKNVRPGDRRADRARPARLGGGLGR